ncbi:hypothetical protein LguiA_014710 [Lonicera macranthoides]
MYTSQMLPSLLFVLVLPLFSPNFLSKAASDSIYNTFVHCLKSHSPSYDKKSSIVYSPKNSSYTSILQSYVRNRRFNTSKTPKPAIIVTPLRESHVQLAVICAKNASLQLKIRSGGHDYEGLSYVSDKPFVLLDMFNIRSIDVNIEKETAWVEAGATLGELYYNIWEKSEFHGFPAGICPTVGVGGHFSGGGYGNMLRKHGLAVDHIIDAKIVDANGRKLDRHAMGEDLFWAIRGGGGASFGVILSYTIKLVRVPEIVTVFQTIKTLEQNATDIVHKWQYVANTMDHGLFIRIELTPTGHTNTTKTITATFTTLFLGDSNRLMLIMNKDFPELGLKKKDCKEMSWIESVLFWANYGPQTPVNVLLSRDYSSGFFKRKSDYVQKPISKQGLNQIWKKMLELRRPGLVFNPYGGKMSEIPQRETPFPHRKGNLYKVHYSANWGEDEGIEAEGIHFDQIRKLYKFMTPFVSKKPRGAFLNYRDLDIGANDHNGKNSYKKGRVYGVKYFKKNFHRLVRVKTMVDPENFFRNEQSIPVLPHYGGHKVEVSIGS